MSLIDSYNRTIDYLRVSVTDRCNFRCVYCMPDAGAPVSPKDQLLSLAEIERLLRIAVDLGITKIRFTGGEPLVRSGIADLIANVGSMTGVSDLAITTNGFLLKSLAVKLARGGLRRINVSLDTLKAERFVRIARRGNLQQVLAGIDAAVNAGLSPIKINCVVMRGWNEDEVVEFAKLTLDQPFDIRFIELMPINWSRGDDSLQEMNDYFALSAKADYQRESGIRLFAGEELNSFRRTFRMTQVSEQKSQLDARQMRQAFVSTAETRSRIESALGMLKQAEIITNGPSRAFRLEGAYGTIGFISQITNDMCVNCNRLRITADGQLRPCLMADGEVDLRSPLREGADDAEIADLFRLTVQHKPKEHRLEDGLAPQGRNMSQLGG